MTRAIERHQSGDLDQALADYTTVLETQPEHADTLQLLGTLHLQKSELDKAQYFLERSINIDPTLSQAHTNLASVLSMLGQIPRAMEHCRSALELNPALVQARVNLGNLLRHQGQLKKAEEAYRRALQDNPVFFDAAFNLATLLIEKEQPHDALSFLEQCRTIQPNRIDLYSLIVDCHLAMGNHQLAVDVCLEAMSWNPGNGDLREKYGNVLGEMGRHTEAAACFEQLIKPGSGSSPDQQLRCQYKLGLSLLHQEKTDEAIACYRQLLQDHPEHADAWHDLGLALHRKGQHDEAKDCFNKAIQLQPSKGMFHYNYARLLDAQNRIDETIEAYRRAIEVDSKNIHAYRALSTFYRRHSDYEKAIATLCQALTVFPNHSDVIFDIGINYENWGKPEEALRYYLEVAKLAPDDEDAQASIAAIYRLRGEDDRVQSMLRPLIDKDKPAFRAITTFAAIAPGLGEEDRALRLLKTALTYPEINDEGRAELYFLLGKLYDKEKQYKKAFEHYQLGNQLVRPSFDRQAVSRKFEALIHAHSSDRHAVLPRSTIDSEVPVFIVGMERSGTSLVEQILASHPSVFGAGELPAMPDLVERLERQTRKPYPACTSDITADLLDQLGNSYLESASKGAGKVLRITDKLPANFVHLGLIDLLFPKARIIHCQRDPRDTCLSCYFQRFGGNLPYAYDLEDLGYYYGQYRRLMVHWENVIQAPLLNVRYETLVAQPEEQIHRLLDFMGLDWHDQCLDFHQTRRTVATCSTDQVRQPLYKSSTARWKHYQPYLAPLFAALDKP